MAGDEIIRIGFFVGVLAAVAAWEVVAPRRPLTDSRRRRWFVNISLSAIDTAVARFVLPVLPLEMAIRGRDGGWGILNAFPLPGWARILLALLALDLLIYLQHVLFHFLPVLWRLHRMHHTDLDIDVTTGTRFHPVEILVSQGIKVGVVALLGAPVAAVVAFEVVLNATSLFNHGNIRISPAVDRWLRLIVVTPDMHRVHHSVVPRETNSNFGFNLPWWDRLAGTYRPQPAGGHEGMVIGLREFRAPEMLTLRRLLLQPFRSA